MRSFNGFSRLFVVVTGLVHAIALAWLLSDWDRDRLIVFKTYQVTSEADVNVPPSQLQRYEYQQDAPTDLAGFRDVARHVINGARSDAERFSRLSDYVYGLRRKDRRAIGTREYAYQLSDLYQMLLDGQPGTCGHMVWIMTALTRSLGYDTRQIVWFTARGEASHSALEIFSNEYGQDGRWVYFDVNLNGYGVDRDGEPLSIAALRTNLLTGEDVHFVSNAELRDWDEQTLIDRIRAYPLDWYLMNNRLLYYERSRRFGPMNFAYPLLTALPYPADRVLDNLFGMRETRLSVPLQFGDNALLTLRGLHVAFWYLLAMLIGCGMVLFLDARSHSAAVRRAHGGASNPASTAALLQAALDE